jgi:HD-GYP domain-containing protein (c-di-GMP phosphodiesterase class II)
MSSLRGTYPLRQTRRFMPLRERASPGAASGNLKAYGGQQVTALATAPWMSDAVEALARELRNHHAPTAEHSHRLAALAREVADHLMLDPLDATEVELVAVLHDVGKLTIDPRLLDWQGPLNDGQRASLRRHTIAGEELLAEIAGLEHLATVVRATHGSWDGTGFPDGLAREGIPLTARIVSVADSFDAMTSDRAYRSALPRREACRRLRTCAGVQFDPQVVDALLRVVRCAPLRTSS